jgi:hypothetical protein
MIGLHPRSTGMSPSEIGPQWQKLCEEHAEAQDAYLRAFAAVDQRFSAIGKGTSKLNPTSAELTEFDKTRHAWQDVMRRTGEFVNRSAESSGQRFVWPTELGR